MHQTAIGTDVVLAASLLRASEPVGIPTETVYGLAANALKTDAVIKIFEAKKRPRFNPLIIHVKNIDDISNYAHLSGAALELATCFMPGPLTLLLPKKSVVPDLVTSGSSLVAIRIPNHPLTLQLLSAIDFPLAAPSANVFGYVSPTTARHVYKGLKGIIPYILDGGACTVGVESTIAEVTNEKVLIHRVGGIGIEAIAARTTLPVEMMAPVQHRPQTPGQLKSHYATNTPLLKGNIAALLSTATAQKIAIISLNKVYKPIPAEHHFLLSPTANLHEAASNLFDTLRKVDEMGYELILAENFPNEGLGWAINDRLNRAQVVYK